MKLDRRALLRLTGAGAIGSTVPATGPVSGEDATGRTVYGGWKTLHAVDADTGEIRWTYDEFEVNSSPTVVNGTVYVGTSAGLTAIDAVTGDPYWTNGAVSKVSLGGPTVVGGTVYVGDEGQLVALDGVDCGESWTVDSKLGDDPDDPPQFVTPSVIGDSVYAAEYHFGDREGRLYKLDAGTGEEQWEYSRFSIAPNTEPTVFEGSVYVGDRGAELHRVNADSGDLEQLYGDFQQIIDMAPAVQRMSLPSGETPVVVAGTRRTPADLLAYDVDDPTNPLGEFEEHGNDFFTAPAIVGDLVYASNDDGFLYAADPGGFGFESAWSFEVGTEPSAPTIHDGVVYVSGSNRLYAVEAGRDGGTELWSTAWAGNRFRAPTVVDDPSGGHSVGSRVQHGVLGHHHEWAGTDPGDEPEDGSGVVAGTVTDRHGEGVGDLDIVVSRVCADGASGVPIGTVTTGSDGTFSAEVPAGTETTFVVSVDDPLFEPTKDRIEATVGPNGTTEVSIDVEIVLLDDRAEKLDLADRLDEITVATDERDGVEAALESVETAARNDDLTVTEAENAIERLRLGEEITDATLTVIGTWDPRNGVSRPDVDLVRQLRNKAIFLVATEVIGIVTKKAKRLLPDRALDGLGQLNDALTLLNLGTGQVDRTGTVPTDPVEILVEGGQVTYGLVRHQELNEPADGEQVIDDLLGKLGYGSAVQRGIETGNIGSADVTEGTADALAGLNDAVADAGTTTFDLDIGAARTRRDNAVDEVYSTADSILSDLDPFSPSDVLSDLIGVVIDIAAELRNLDDGGGLGTQAAPLVAAAVIAKLIIKAVLLIDTAISVLQAYDVILSLLAGKGRMVEFRSIHNDAVGDLARTEGSQ